MSREAVRLSTYTARTADRWWRMEDPKLHRVLDRIERDEELEVLAPKVRASKVSGTGNKYSFDPIRRNPYWQEFDQNLLAAK